MGDRELEVVQGQLDGVPFFAAETPPPFIAAVMFRVGRADETAAFAGITHLVEHLLLPSATYLEVDCNGTVDNLYTAIWAAGPQPEVRRFLERALERLRDLPLDRLDVERQILTAEENAQAWSGVRQAFALRFGPIGHGLTGYGEYGLHRVTEEDVALWAAERFTAGNAALWMTDPSFELSLSLRGADPRPAPEPRPIAYVEYPCVYRAGEPGGVLLSMLVERSEAFSIGLRLLERRLRDRLRYGLGLSYDVSAESMPLTGGLAHAWVGGDVSPVNVEPWCHEAVQIFDALATDGPSDEELESEKARIRRTDADPARWAGWLEWMAAQHLLGAPYESQADSRRASERVTRTEVADALGAARSSLLLLGPEETPQLDGFPEYPLSSPNRIEGRVHRPFALRERLRPHRRLSASPNGLSLAWPDGTATTASYDSTVLCFRELDARVLLTDDGFFVRIEPDDWTAGKKLVAEIDRAIPPGLVVSEDPSLQARVDEVERLATSTFKRTWLISDELSALPHLLEGDERLLVLAAASRGWTWGLVAVTDRRLRFVSGDGTSKSLVVERTRLQEPQVDGSDLAFSVEGERVSLTSIEPKGKAAELLAELLRPGLEA